MSYATNGARRLFGERFVYCIFQYWMSLTKQNKRTAVPYKIGQIEDVSNSSHREFVETN